MKFAVTFAAVILCCLETGVISVQRSDEVLPCCMYAVIIKTAVVLKTQNIWAVKVLRGSA